MGKIFGFLIGAIFGPIGALIGFLFGSLFDFFKGPDSSFYSQEPDGLFENAFPLLAAAITRAAGVSKPKVIATKNVVIQVFGNQKAQRIMPLYKKYVERGYKQELLQNACDSILFSFDYRSKIYVISLLFTILRAKERFLLDELYMIERISRWIGISGYDFEMISKKFRTPGQFYEKEYTSHVSKSDPYQILGISSSAGDEEIKKQYRQLCKKYHPDLTAHLPEKEREEAEVKMKTIINAYESIKKERKLK